MKILNIHIETDDLFWAVCLAGAIKTARADTTGVNPKIKCSIEPTTPAIEVLSKVFDKRAEGSYVVTPPKTEAEFIALDHFSNMRQKREVEELHGALTDDNLLLNKNNTVNLASNLLLYRFNIVTKPTYYYPVFKDSELKEYKGYQIASVGKYKDAAIAFVRGRGIEDPKIIDLDTLPPLERIKASCSNSMKAICVNPEDEILAVHRSYYKGYDKVTGTCPIILVIPDKYEYFSRNEAVWANLLTVLEDYTNETMELRGRNWNYREQANHSVVQFLKNRAKESVCQQE